MTGYFQGNLAAIAKTFKLKRDTVVKVWRQFVATEIQASKIYSNWCEKPLTKQPRFY